MLHQRPSDGPTLVRVVWAPEYEVLGRFDRFSVGNVVLRIWKRCWDNVGPWRRGRRVGEFSLGFYKEMLSGVTLVVTGCRRWHLALNDAFRKLGQGAVVYGTEVKSDGRDSRRLGELGSLWRVSCKCGCNLL